VSRHPVDSGRNKDDDYHAGRGAVKFVIFVIAVIVLLYVTRVI
jgi:hypothetical protein